jgi:hypothetical protein
MRKTAPFHMDREFRGQRQQYHAPNAIPENVHQHHDGARCQQLKSRTLSYTNWATQKERREP